jgi:KTSC domain
MKYTQDTPDSSAVTSYTYDSDTLDLEVKFKSGASYRFLNVKLVEFDKLKAAPSVGGFIAANCKNYEFERLEAPKQVPNPPTPTEQPAWPFPTSPKPAAPPKEESYDDIIGWSPEEEEEFMRMVENKPKL